MKWLPFDQRVEANWLDRVSQECYNAVTIEMESGLQLV